MPHLALRQHRLRGGLEARQAGVGDDRQHAVQVVDGEHLRLVPRRLAHRQNARMGKRAADEGEVAHARKPDVGDELALAAQIAVVLAAEHRLPDTAAWAVARATIRHGSVHLVNSCCPIKRRNLRTYRTQFLHHGQLVSILTA